MSDLVSNGYLKDKNGNVMEIVDKAARDGVERLTEEIEALKGGGTTTETVTKTGEVVTINAAKDAEIKVEGDTTEAVTLVHHGKNFLLLPTYNKTIAGLTVTNSDDGTITVNGTATSAAYIDFAKSASPLYLPAGIYSITTNIDKSGFTFTMQSASAIFYTGGSNPVTNVNASATSPNRTFEIKESGEVYGYIKVNSGTTCENVVLSVQIAKGNTVNDLDSSNFSSYEPPNREETSIELPAIVSAFEGVNIFYTKSENMLTVHTDVEVSGGDDKAYVFDPYVWGVRVISFDGDPTGMTKDNYVPLMVSFQDKDGNPVGGTSDIKLQGSSSIGTGVEIGAPFDTELGGLFNFTIKFPEAFEAAEGWGAQKKYCIKVNAIDHSHARNVGSCKLWGEIVKSRENVPAELSSLINGGAIDGFPVIIVLNGKFYALGTFNIPKDGWMFGNPKAVLCADAHSDATKFKGLARLTDDFELEYVEDEDNADWVLTSINRAIQAVIDSDGSDLDTTVGQYIDIPSAIDYYIHTVDEKADDGMDKNYILVTFDGVKWYFSAYDRDTTYGLHWNGKLFNSPVTGVTYAGYANTHRLMYLIRHYKSADLKARAIQLRNGVKSEANVMQVFTNFTAGIPSEVLAQNCRRWPLLRSTSASNLAQIVNWYRLRRQLIDKEIDAMT